VRLQWPGNVPIAESGPASGPPGRGRKADEDEKRISGRARRSPCLVGSWFRDRYVSRPLEPHHPGLSRSIRSRRGIRQWRLCGSSPGRAGRFGIWTWTRSPARTCKLMPRGERSAPGVSRYQCEAGLQGRRIFFMESGNECLVRMMWPGSRARHPTLPSRFQEITAAGCFSMNGSAQERLRLDRSWRAERGSRETIHRKGEYFGE